MPLYTPGFLCAFHFDRLYIFSKSTASFYSGLCPVKTLGGHGGPGGPSGPDTPDDPYDPDRIGVPDAIPSKYWEPLTIKETIPAKLQVILAKFQAIQAILDKYQAILTKF